MFSVRFQSCKLPWTSARVPQHLFPRSVDGDGGGTVKKESKKEVKTVANNSPEVKLCVFCYILTVQNVVYVLYKFL
jgi:hypothetical protein